MEYLLILLGFLLLAIIFEKTHRIHLYLSLKERLEIAGTIFAIGIIWDTYAVWRGHWAFPDGGTLGIKIGLLPLEEYLFFIIMPFFGLTLYKLLDSKYRRRGKKQKA